MISEIQAAFDAQLQTVWQGDTAFEGVIYTATDGVPYVAVRMAGLSSMADGVGPSVIIRWSGSYQISIYRPAQEGKAEALSWAEKIRAAFPRGMQLPSGAANAAVITNTVIQPATSTMGFFMQPVSVIWFACEVPS